MKVCQPCNSSFAEDEEYLGAFLGAVLAGSADPAAQVEKRAARTFESNPGLRSRVEKSKQVDRNLLGEETTTWMPENDRIENVVVKNARGHAYYEITEPMLEKPSRVAEAIFSSPVACLETLERRIRGIENVTARGTPADRDRRRALRQPTRPGPCSPKSSFPWSPPGSAP